MLRQSFMAAAEIFRSIETLSRGVIVPYDKKGKKIITELCSGGELHEKYNLIKQAQRYSVNVFNYLFDQLIEREIIREVEKGAGIYYLDDQYYSEQFGLSEEVINEMELLVY